MQIENLAKLKIHKLTQEQYDRALVAGTLSANELYLTPEEAHYANDEVDQLLQTKADQTHVHDGRYYTETEIDSKLVEIQTCISEKSDSSHTHVANDVSGLSTIATSGSWDDLEDKPFYRGRIYWFKGELDLDNSSSVVINSSALTDDAEYHILFEGIDDYSIFHNTTGTASSYHSYNIDDIELDSTEYITSICMGDTSEDHIVTFTNPMSGRFKLEIYERTAENLKGVKALDEQFVPESIARVSALKGKADTIHTNTMSDILEFDVTTVETTLIDKTVSSSGYVSPVDPLDFSTLVGKHLKVCMYETEYRTTCIFNATQNRYEIDIGGDDKYHIFQDVGSTLVNAPTSLSGQNIKLMLVSTIIPEEYIPDTVARVADINTTLSTSYYTQSQTDESLKSTVETSISTHNTSTDAHSDIRELISAKADTGHKHTGITDGTYSAIMQEGALVQMYGDGAAAAEGAPTVSESSNVDLGSRSTPWNIAYVNDVYITDTGDYLSEILKTKASDSSITSSITSHNSSTTSHNDIRTLIDGLTNRLNALADSDDTTLDQLSEIVSYIKSNRSLIDSVTTLKLNVSDVIDNLTTAVSNKALSANQGVEIKKLIDSLQASLDSHKHEISSVTGLQVALDGKAPASHTSDTNVHITSDERTSWNAAKTHADSAHAPSNAEKNQNAFSNVAVGSTTIAAGSATDTLTLAGSNVTITPDAANDKVTIGITQDNVTAALGYTPLSEDSGVAIIEMVKSYVIHGTADLIIDDASGLHPLQTLQLDRTYSEIRNVLQDCRHSPDDGKYLGYIDVTLQLAITEGTTCYDVCFSSITTCSNGDILFYTTAPGWMTGLPDDDICIFLTEEDFAYGAIGGIANYRANTAVYTATSTDGRNYTLNFIEVGFPMNKLRYGCSFVIVPNMTSYNELPNLTVQCGSGAETYPIYRGRSNDLSDGYPSPKLRKDIPIRVMLTPRGWMIENQPVPAASDLDGTVSIENGGTNATTAADARTNLGAMADVPVTSADAGKFLRVSSSGTWVAEALQYAEDITF